MFEMVLHFSALHVKKNDNGLNQIESLTVSIY